MPDTSPVAAIADNVVAEASSARVRAYFTEHKEPPDDVAQGLRQLRRSLLEARSGEVLKLYEALPTDIAAWLGDDSLDAEMRGHLGDILERNREAFAALAEL